MKMFISEILEPIKQTFKFLFKIPSFWKLYQNYGYDGETVEFIIENYQEVLQNRTKLMSKPTYYAKGVIEQIDSWYEEMGYVRIERQDKPKYNYDKFKTALSVEELAKELCNIEIDCCESLQEYVEEYLEKKCEVSE